MRLAYLSDFLLNTQNLKLEGKKSNVIAASSLLSTCPVEKSRQRAINAVHDLIVTGGVEELQDISTLEVTLLNTCAGLGKT